jgi:hypothetical protein
MVPIIKKHIGVKTINKRKYLMVGLTETYKKAIRMARPDRKKGYKIKIFKLEAENVKYPYRVYERKPIRVYDERSGTFVWRK